MVSLLIHCYQSRTRRTQKEENTGKVMGLWEVKYWEANTHQLFCRYLYRSAFQVQNSFNSTVLFQQFKLISTISKVMKSK
jgi:hypothetical protein